MEQTEVVGGPHGRAGDFGPPRTRGMLVRGLLIALGAVLGIVLLAQGVIVIGVILLTMAVLRIVMIVQLRRRHAWRIQRRQLLAARMRQRMP